MSYEPKKENSMPGQEQKDKKQGQAEQGGSQGSKPGEQGGSQGTKHGEQGGSQGTKHGDQDKIK